MNSFLADGGDGFSVLTQGTDRVGGAVDTDALERYFATAPPEPAGAQPDRRRPVEAAFRWCYAAVAGTSRPATARAIIPGA